MRTSAPATSARADHGLSIWARLVLVVLAVVIPIGALTFGATWLLAENTRERQRESLLYSSRTILSALDAQLREYAAIARVLAGSDAILQDDLTAFRELAARAFPGSREAWVIVAKLDGQEILNTLGPGDGVQFRSAEALASQEVAVRTGRPNFSDVTTEDGEWTTTIDVPIPRNGVPFRVLAITVRTDSFVRLLNLSSLPDGWVASISDRNYRIVARSRDHDNAVGLPAPDNWRARIAGIPEGIVEARTLEGEATIAAHATSSLNGWRVAVGSSVEVFEAPMREVMAWTNGLAATVAGFSIVLALWAASRISEPVRALERNVEALVAGREADVRTRLPEVQRVWAAVRKEVTARAEREAALLESEERFRTMADNAPVLIWVSRGDQVEFINRYFVDFVGSDPPDWQGYHTLRYIHPDDRATFLAEFQEAVAQSVTFAAEFRLRRQDGVYRWMKTNGLPRIGPGGELLGYVGSTFDISDIRAREEHIRFIMQELSHRSKNLLAVIISIARQTARQSADYPSFEARFGERVRALSDAHDLLVTHDWTGARLRDVAAGQLSPFSTGGVDIRGEDITVHPTAVQNIALALHELATNAAKYGALSVPQGSVVIAWEVRGEDPDATLHMTWTEHGGPPVVAPKRAGFGTTVLQRVTPHALLGAGTVSFEPGGLKWTLDIPAHWIVGEAGEMRAAAPSPA